MAPNSNTSAETPIVNGAPLDGPADCTLACDEGHLTAHKIVLCAHSKYLLDILNKYPNAEHPIIILTELNITDIKILVNYMYTGELVITNDDSPTSLLRAAQILKIDSLTDFDDDEEDEDEDNALDESRVSPIEQHQHQHQHRREQINNNNNNNSNSINHQHSKDTNNKIRCHLCNIGLSDVKCLYRHVLTRHLPEKWGYKCEFCDREFSRDDHLMRHYTTKHKNMEFDREKIRETRRLNREMAKNFHDQISTI